AWTRRATHCWLKTRPSITWILLRRCRAWAAKWAWTPPTNGRVKPSENGARLLRWTRPSRRGSMPCGVNSACKALRTHVGRMNKHAGPGRKPDLAQRVYFVLLSATYLNVFFISAGH